MVTLLRANYPTTGSAPPEPDPPPAPSGATFSLAINADFDPDSPVLKNGEVLTGAALQTWKGIAWLINNHQARRYVEAGGGDLNQLAARDDLYHYRGPLAVVYNELAMVQRLTGWAKVLDEQVRIWLIQKAQLHIGYRDPDTGARWPTHSYRQWAWRQSSAKYRGTDYHEQDNPRTHAPLAQLLYALRLNESAVSPAGYDYEQVADDLEDYLRDWVKVWSGAELVVGIAKNGSPASGWSANYEGNRHKYYQDLVGRRPDTGDWPIQSRHHTHTHIGASILHIWLGLAIPDFAAATPVGLNGITDLYFSRNLYHYTGIYGDQVVWPRSLHDTGHGTFEDPVGNYPQPSTYVRYPVMDMQNLWLEGSLPDYPELFGVPVTRTMNQYMFTGLNTSQGMRGDLLGGNSKKGTAAPERLLDGKALDFESAADNGFSASRNNSNLVSSALCQLQAFDTPDDKLENHIWDRMTRSSLFRDDGDELGKPRVMSPSIGLLLKQLGARDWDLSSA